MLAADGRLSGRPGHGSTSAYELRLETAIMRSRSLIATCVLSAVVASLVPLAALAQDKTVSGAGSPAQGGAAPAKTDAFPEAAFLDQEVVGVGVLRIDRIRNTPFFAGLRKGGLLKEIEQALGQIGSGLDDLDRASVAIGQDVVEIAARQAGLKVSAPPATAEISPQEMQNKVKQIALAFHNYHDAYRRLPRANGNGEGNKTGLSWRVHVLPFLDQAPLYQEFNLDEPWDSEHNKPLVEKMPDLFRMPGVQQPGKTAFHVFTGKGTLFEGEKGKTFADVRDGLSNTLLAIAAAPETATEWTKPGGLEFDAKTCREALGTTEASLFFAVMGDGAARPMPSDITAETLSLLIQIGDGQVVDIPGPSGNKWASRPTPTLILAFARPYDRSKIPLRDEPEIVEGEKLYVFPGSSGWFASDKLMIIGPAQTLRRLIHNHKSKTPTAPSMLGQLTADSDAALAFDLRPQAKLMEAIVRKHPLADIFLPVTSLSLVLNISQPDGGTLLELAAAMPDSAAAATLLESLAPGLEQVKETVSKLPIPTPTPVLEKGKTLGLAAIAAATLKQDESRVVLRVPVPEGFSEIHELVVGSMATREDAAAALQTRKNNLKQIALGFHNHEAAYGNFPGAGRKTPDGKIGLSWRVHILPYVGQANLYNQFNTDQPWDSDTNKPLIEKMPALYKTLGVAKPGHTAIHVFTGKGAPFAEDRSPKLRDFTDGTSNTILAVEAGPDKAEVWTKPGGLDFDPEKPIEALGKFTGETFQSVIADGSVKGIARKINADILRRLIEFQDGEPLQLP